MQHMDNYSNIPSFIINKMDRKLHNQPGHPINIIKRIIYDYFSLMGEFETFDDLETVVSVEHNFDKLLIPLEHRSRTKSDTYYVTENTVLRTHTSAHQNELLSQGIKNFLVTGDVYRKDEIDATHYPIFHQMEGVMVVPDGKDPEAELLIILKGIVSTLFPNKEYRIKPDYFPFTDPSFEIEVNVTSDPIGPDNVDGNWMEILGSGVVRDEIVKSNGLTEKFVAFGLGLDRLAMILFNIPDIRILWSQHPRFAEQFTGEIFKFVPFSQLECQTCDIAFWIPVEQIIEGIWVKENDFFDFIQSECNDFISKVELIDKFVAACGKVSRAYRLTYSPVDPSLKNGAIFKEICNQYSKKILKGLPELGLVAR